MKQPVSDVAVMDQYAVIRQAADPVGVQTPLAHLDLPPKRAHSSIDGIVHSKENAAKGESTVSLEVAPLTGILSLRAGSSREALSQALHQSVSLALPERLQSHSIEKGCCIRWMSPDEWLLTCAIDQAFAIEQQLRAAVNGRIAIVNVSGAYCLLTVSGADALNLLAKSTAYNINAENFAEGKVVNTMMAKAQITLRALAEERFEILVRRSFADYLGLWLQRAGREYGLQAVRIAR